MFQIACPHCGPRNQEEFTYERSADSVVRLDDAPDVAMAALFSRANLRGVDDEIWVHAYGCGQWLHVRRDRMTHVIDAVTAI